MAFLRILCAISVSTWIFAGTPSTCLSGSDWNTRASSRIRDNNNATRTASSGFVCTPRKLFLRQSRRRTSTKDTVTVIATEGSCVKVDCVSRVPVRLITWARNTTEIGRQLTHTHDFGLNTLVLRFRDVALSDAGYYTCEGIGRGRRMRGRIRVIVLPRDNSCRFTQLIMKRFHSPPKPISIFAHAGDCVRVHCVAFLDNIVNLEWEAKYISSNLHSSTPAALSRSLELRNVSSRDAGYFTCRAHLRNGKIFTRQVHLSIASTAVQKDTCGPTFFRCATGECMFLQYHCDHETHCPDGSDEKDCPGEDGCLGKYHCNNGRCIDMALVCDRFHKDDCGDMTDEFCLNVKYQLPSANPPFMSQHATATPVISVHSSSMPWLNTTVHCVIGITVGIVIFTASAVIFIYRHKIRQTRDIRRRIATVRRVRCAIQNDYQPPPMRLGEGNPFLGDYHVSDYGISDDYAGANIFLNVNSVHYMARSAMPPQYSDVEDARATETPPPPYDHHRHSASSSDYERLFGNPWHRHFHPRTSHDYINISQQIINASQQTDSCPLNNAIGQLSGAVNQSCQCSPTCTDSLNHNEHHEYENCKNMRLPVTNQHLPDPQHSSCHLPDPQHSSHRLPDPQHSSHHLPDHQHSIHHLPDPQHSSHHVPDPQHSSHHVPDPQHSSHHLPDPQHSDLNHLSYPASHGSSVDSCDLSLIANCGCDSCSVTTSSNYTTQPSAHIAGCKDCVTSKHDTHQIDSQLTEGDNTTVYVLPNGDQTNVLSTTSISTQTPVSSGSETFVQCFGKPMTHDTKEQAVPLPAVGQAVPSPAVGQAVTLPAVGQAVPLTAVGQAVPLPAATPGRDMPPTSSPLQCKTCASFSRAKATKPIQSATYPITNVHKVKYSAVTPFMRPDTPTNQKPIHFVSVKTSSTLHRADNPSIKPRKFVGCNPLVCHDACPNTDDIQSPIEPGVQMNALNPHSIATHYTINSLLHARDGLATRSHALIAPVEYRHDVPSCLPGRSNVPLSIISSHDRALSEHVNDAASLSQTNAHVPRVDHGNHQSGTRLCQSQLDQLLGPNDITYKETIV